MMKFEIKDGKMIASDDGDTTRQPLPMPPPSAQTVVAEHARDILTNAVGSDDPMVIVFGLIFAITTVCDAAGLPLTRIAATLDVMDEMATNKHTRAEVQAAATSALAAVVQRRQQLIREAFTAHQRKADGK